MLSFNNDQSIKNALVYRMDKHIELDELVQGATGDDGKGCTVWCALNNGDMRHGYDHSAFPAVLGLPEWLAKLQDSIFEGLNTEYAKTFSSQWVKAIPVGKNIEPVKWKFCAFIMKENIERVLLLDISDELKKQVVDSIKMVLKLHTDAIETGEWNDSSAWSARSAAWSARSAAESAESAAWSAMSAADSARSAARSAESAAESAADSARSAARSAADSARSAAWSAESAADSARSAAFKKYADYLIELLTNA